MRRRSSCCICASVSTGPSARQRSVHRGGLGLSSASARSPGPRAELVQPLVASIRSVLLVSRPSGLESPPRPPHSCSSHSISSCLRPHSATPQHSPESVRSQAEAWDPSTETSAKKMAEVASSRFSAHFALHPARNQGLIPLLTSKPSLPLIARRHGPAQGP